MYTIGRSTAHCIGSHRKRREKPWSVKSLPSVLGAPLSMKRTSNRLHPIHTQWGLVGREGLLEPGFQIQY